MLSVLRRSYYVLCPSAFALLALLAGAVVSAEKIDTTAILKPFISDGCSIFPDGNWQSQTLWYSCCFKHDYDYWKGGTETQRKSSDNALKQCVIELGEAEIAELMLTGVRAGGGPYWPTPYRWGYGWPMGRGYKALNTAEQQQVQKLSLEIPWIKDLQLDKP